MKHAKRDAMIKRLFAKLRTGLWTLVVTWKGDVVYASHAVDLHHDEKIQKNLCGDGLRPHWQTISLDNGGIESGPHGNVCENEHCDRVRRQTPCVMLLEPIGRRDG